MFSISNLGYYGIFKQTITVRNNKFILYFKVYFKLIITLNDQLP